MAMRKRSHEFNHQKPQVNGNYSSITTFTTVNNGLSNSYNDFYKQMTSYPPPTMPTMYTQTYQMYAQSQQQQPTITTWSRHHHKYLGFFFLIIDA